MEGLWVGVSKWLSEGALPPATHTHAHCRLQLAATRDQGMTHTQTHTHTHTLIMDECATVEQEWGGARGGRMMLLGGAGGAALEGAAGTVEAAWVLLGG